MVNVKNGDKAFCQVCGQGINYYFGWRHDLGENQRHQAWPKQVEYAPAWPVLTDEDEVILLTSGQPARLAQW